VPLDNCEPPLLNGIGLDDDVGKVHALALQLEMIWSCSMAATKGTASDLELLD